MSEPSKSIQLDDVLITEELSRRSPRQPNLQAENQAMRSLVWQLAHEPDQMLQRLVDSAQELCNAGTAGVSLIETQPSGEEVFRWGALAGALASHVGGCVSRHFSPCGVCLEQKAPVLFAYPERYFTDLQQANLPMPEMLVLPLVVADYALGTLWLVTHHEQRQFDPEDVRLMTGLADFTAATLLRSQQQAQELLTAGTALQQESTERKLAEERALALIDNLPGGAAFVVDRDLRYLLAAGEALAIAGFKPQDFIGRTIFEVLPPELAASYEPMYRIALAGEAFEHEHQAHDRWYISRGTPLPDDEGNIYAVLAVSYDVTDRKQAEATIAADLRDTRLLHDLALQVASSNPDQDLYQSILDTAITLMNADMGSLQIRDRNKLHLQAWRGFHPDAAAGWQTVGLDDGSSCGAALQAGKRVIVSNTETCDFMANTADLESYRLCGIQAVQSTPLLSQGGQFIGMISTHWCAPHHPSDRELRFLDLLARQAADLIEQRQAKAALHASEAKYRSLFNSIDEGFVIAEMIYNEAGQPVDALYLEGNPAASRLTGVANYTEQRLSAVLPQFESYWLEIYDRVLQTGESERAEQFTASLNRWYDFYVFSISATPDTDGDRRVAVIFQDITERKRTETILQANAARQACLLELSDTLRSLVDVDAIRYQAACILGQHLGANRVGYAEVDDNNETIVVARHYTDGVPGIEGRYRDIAYEPELGQALKAGKTVVRRDIAHDPSLTDAEKAAYAVLQLGAIVNVPVLKAGRLVGVLFVHFQTAHEWSDSELALIAEVAERIQDAVERAHIEFALRESEENYRRLFTSIDEGFCTIEVLFDDAGVPYDHRILQANPGFERHVGIANPVGKTARELMPDVDPWWHDLYAQVIQTGQSVRQEIYSEILNRWFEVLVARVGEASLGQVAVVFDDITERKQAEATVAADLRDTQLLQELSARLISEANIQVLYDKILATAIALSRADAGSFQCFDLAHDELKLLATRGFSQTMVDHFDRIRSSSHTSCGQAILQGQRAFVDFDAPDDPDGSLKMHLDAGLLSAQSTPLISRSGQLIGMFSTHWRKHHRPSDRELRFLDLLARQAADLIEQRQAELERRQLLEREQAIRQEAERANRVKDEFLAILSHELRSPLNPILGWSKLLQTQKLDAEKTQRALATIERNAKLQTQLIDDLLDVARILRGKLKIEAAPVNLTVVIEAALEVVRNSAEAKGIALQFDLIDPCEVNGDEGRLQQVVWNLLSNAIKFTPQGGQVKVRLAALEHQAQIAVTDTGKGIQPDFLPHLFQAFRQEDVSISRQYGGLGLGLAIVKYLVDAHGGSVNADSPGEGQGATFTVRLPLRQAPPIPPSTAPSASEARDLDGIKVLAVDDSDDARELLAMVLTLYGAEVHLAASGAEALDQLANFQADVLVCDIGMPTMNGYELIQQIRALPGDQGGKVPAIAVTAFAREEDRQRVLNHGFQEHIAKPIEPEQLVNAIAQLTMRQH